MSRTYALFDPGILGASLVLDVGNTTVRTSSTVDAHRCVKGDQYQSQFISSVSFVFWSPNGSNPSLTPVAGVPPLIFGICTSAAGTNKYVGEQSSSFGFCPGDGKFYSNGAVVDTFSAVAFGAPCKLVLDPVNATLDLYVKGVHQGQISVTASQSWTFAATVSGAADNLEIQQFSGGDPPMPYPDPSEPGWFLPITGIAPVLVSTESYLTAATDTPAHEKYAGDIDKQHSLAISNGVGAVWPWGASAPGELHAGGSLVQLQLNDQTATATNRTEKYVRLQGDAARGALSQIAVNQSGNAATSAVPIFTAILDHAERDTIQTVQVYLRGLLDLLQAAMRRAVYTRADDPSIAGRTVAAMIGPCRNYVGDYKGTLDVGLTDAPIGAFGTNRDAGKPIVLPTEFTLNADSQSVTLAAAAAGKLTWETTTQGGSFDPGAPDYLDTSSGPLGMFVGATPDGNGHPTGWTAASNAGLSQANMWQVVATGVKQDCGIAPNKRMSLQESSILLRAGRSYAYKVVVHRCPLFGNQTGNHYTNPALLELTWQTATAGTYYWAKFPLDAPNGGSKTITGILNVTATTDQPFGFRLNTNELSYSAGLNLCIIESVTLNELPNVADNVSLDGPGLTQMIAEIVINRGPYNSSQVSTTESDAIDADTGFIYGLGLKADENISCAEATKRILNSCTATDYYTDQYRVWRLSKPEDVADADIAFDLDYRKGDFLSPLIQIPDMAENLSAHAYGCRNIDPYGDGDFLNTSQGDCPNNVRSKLKLPYQFKATTTKQLAQRYAQRAYGKEPFPTCLDRQADVQTFIDHACDYYTDERNFYEADVWMPPIRRRFVDDTSGGSWVDANGIFVLGTAMRVFYPMDGWPDAPSPLNVPNIGMRKLWILAFAPMTPDQNKCKVIFAGL